MKQFTGFLFILIFILSSCASKEVTTSEHEHEHAPPPAHEIKREDRFIENVENTKEQQNKEELDLTAFERTPTEWGENVSGVKQQFKTTKKEIALTFDACGGMHGSQVDEKLIRFLNEEKIPVTLFINERWIKENEQLFVELAQNPLFQIENHGSEHKPLSVSGGEAWGITATSSPEEARDEIMRNHETVRELIGKEMTFFRSGTAYYDEVAVELAHALGYTVVNFDILGDAGATYSSEQVKNALLEAKPGSIALLHMNQPASGTADGVIAAVPLLKEAGFDFVQLKDVEFER